MLRKSIRDTVGGGEWDTARCAPAFLEMLTVVRTIPPLLLGYDGGDAWLLMLGPMVGQRSKHMCWTRFAVVVDSL